MKTRGFEIVSKYNNAGINLPKRQTKFAAGYDFEAAADFVLPSVYKYDFVRIFRLIKNRHPLTNDDFTRANSILKPFLIPTGIKSYMKDSEFLMIANRSSNPLKQGIVVPNGVGIVDSDYYNNPSNEGEIFVQMLNLSTSDIKISKGQRIAQGIFMPYLLADGEDLSSINEREGGFGSSNNN